MAAGCVAAAAPITAADEVPADRPPSRFARMVFWSGYDRVIARGGPLKLRPGGGISLSAGAVVSVRRLPGLEIQGTAGLKEDGYSNPSSTYRYQSAVIDLLAAWRLAPTRLGAGLSVALDPALSGTGPGSMRFRLHGALGVVVQAEWVSESANGPRSFVGVRLVWQTLQPVGVAGTEGASTVGVLAGLAL